MIYLTCPTCGYFIGTKINEYESKKEKICNNIDLSEEEQGEEIQKLIQSLKLRRYCCKMRVMTAKDLSVDILPIEKK